MENIENDPILSDPFVSATISVKKVVDITKDRTGIVIRPSLTLESSRIRDGYKSVSISLPDIDYRLLRRLAGRRIVNERLTLWEFEKLAREAGLLPEKKI